MCCWYLKCLADIRCIVTKQAANAYPHGSAGSLFLQRYRVTDGKRPVWQTRLTVECGTIRLKLDCSHYTCLFTGLLCSSKLIRARWACVRRWCNPISDSMLGNVRCLLDADWMVWGSWHPRARRVVCMNECCRGALHWFAVRDPQNRPSSSSGFKYASLKRPQVSHHLVHSSHFTCPLEIWAKIK